MKLFNLHGDEWDDGEEREGWRMRIFLSRPGPGVDYWDGED